MTRPEWTPRRKVAMGLSMTFIVGVALASGWAAGSGHAAIGLVGLIVVFVLPSILTIPFYIRRANRRAAEARARREGREP